MPEYGAPTPKKNLWVLSPKLLNSVSLKLDLIMHASQHVRDVVVPQVRGQLPCQRSTLIGRSSLDKLGWHLRNVKHDFH